MEETLDNRTAIKMAAAFTASSCAGVVIRNLLKANLPASKGGLFARLVGSIGAMSLAALIANMVYKDTEGTVNGLYEAYDVSKEAFEKAKEILDEQEG